MRVQKLLLSFLCVVLGYQIVHIDTQLFVGEFSYGDMTMKAKEEIIHFSSEAEAAAFSVFRDTTYTSAVFTGDVLLARNVESLMNKHGVQYPFSEITLPLFGKNTAMIGNFESSMATPHIQTKALEMKFSTDSSLLEAVKGIGFTHFSQANNHALDYGKEGYELTQESLERIGVNPFGHPNSVSAHSVSYLHTVEGEVAIVAINASSEIPSEESVRSVMDLALEGTSLQVVYIHWGTEYSLHHSKTQELLARELVEAGADVIIGHHPHVVQDIGLVDGVVVFYSLGNFLFDQYFSTEVQQGLLLEMVFSDSPTLTLLPVTSEESLSKPKLMGDEARQNFLETLAKRSSPALQESIRAGNIPLAAMVATSTKMAIMMP